MASTQNLGPSAISADLVFIRWIVGDNGGTSRRMRDETSEESQASTPLSDATKKTKPVPINRRGPYTKKDLRRVALEGDRWIAELHPRKVKCGGCFEWKQLDNRNDYYRGLWVKHKGRCKLIPEGPDKWWARIEAALEEQKQATKAQMVASLRAKAILPRKTRGKKRTSINTRNEGTSVHVSVRRSSKLAATIIPPASLSSLSVPVQGSVVDATSVNHVVLSGRKHIFLNPAPEDESNTPSRQVQANRRCQGSMHCGRNIPGGVAFGSGVSVWPEKGHGASNICGIPYYQERLGDHSEHGRSKHGLPEEYAHLYQLGSASDYQMPTSPAQRLGRDVVDYRLKPVDEWVNSQLSEAPVENDTREKHENSPISQAPYLVSRCRVNHWQQQEWPVHEKHVRSTNIERSRKWNVGYEGSKGLDEDITTRCSP